MTDPVPRSPGDLFRSLAESFGLDHSLGQRRGFGSDALMVAGKMFAVPCYGKLLLKLPRNRVDELVASGVGEPFTAGKKRAMAEWVLVGPEAHELWPALAAEARAFVGAAASDSRRGS